MLKFLKRLLIFALISAMIGGGIYHGLNYYKQTSIKPVNVVSVSNFAMEEYWGDSSETYGMVTTDQMQQVGISDTQVITEIYVSEGQKVKKGDPLLSYDTTLSDIELEQAEIAHKKLELSLENAEKELIVIQNLQPYGYTIIPGNHPEYKEPEYESVNTPSFISGKGTIDDPFLYLWGEDDMVDVKMMEGFITKRLKVLKKQAKKTSTEESTTEEDTTEESTEETTEEPSASTEESSTEESSTEESSSETGSSETSSETISEEPVTSESESTEETSEQEISESESSEPEASESETSESETSELETSESETSEPAASEPVTEPQGSSISESTEAERTEEESPEEESETEENSSEEEPTLEERQGAALLEETAEFTEAAETFLPETEEVLLAVAEEPSESQTEESEQTEPEQTEPEQTEPEQTEPEQTEPEQTEPEQTEPEQTEPEQTEPEQTEPEQTEPEQTEPEQTETESSEPETSESTEEPTESTEESTTEAYKKKLADYGDPYVYVGFLTRQDNALNGPLLSVWGLCIEETDNGLRFCYSYPNFDEEDPEDDYYDDWTDDIFVEWGSDFTAAEIAEMRNEKEKEIEDLKQEIKMSQVDLERIRQEINDGKVLSRIDGIVTVVRDPEEASYTGDSVIEVSAGGGFVINVSMGEFDLESMQIGDVVTVNNWDNGCVCEGVISEISEYPTADGDNYGGGNSNVSYYNFKVSLSAEEDLHEYDWCSVMYDTNETVSTGSFYLENMMILDEGGKSYVYIQGEDGKLEKRLVQTGKIIWSSYTEIRGGLTMDDMIAFPYGSNLIEDAEVTEVSLEDFYGY